MTLSASASSLMPVAWLFPIHKQSHIFPELPLANSIPIEVFPFNLNVPCWLQLGFCLPVFVPECPGNVVILLLSWPTFIYTCVLPFCIFSSLRLFFSGKQMLCQKGELKTGNSQSHIKVYL